MKLGVLWDWFVKQIYDEDGFAKVYSWIEWLVMGFMTSVFIGVLLYFVERYFLKLDYGCYTEVWSGIFNDFALVISLVFCGLGGCICCFVIYSELVRTDAYETLRAIEGEEDYKDESYATYHELWNFLRGREQV